MTRVLTSVLLAGLLALAPVLHQPGAMALEAGLDRQAREADTLRVVAERTRAVNANDIEAFLAVYHPEVRLYQYPERLLGTGTQRMRTIFGPLFATGRAAVTVHGQMVLEGTVVSQETLTLNGVSEDLISVYTVEDGQITQVRLIERAD